MKRAPESTEARVLSRYSLPSIAFPIDRLLPVFERYICMIPSLPSPALVTTSNTQQVSYLVGVARDIVGAEHAMGSPLLYPICHTYSSSAPRRRFGRAIALMYARTHEHGMFRYVEPVGFRLTSILKFVLCFLQTAVRKSHCCVPVPVRCGFAAQQTTTTELFEQ